METAKAETDESGDQGLWDLEGASARDRWSVGLLSLSLILQTSQQVPDERNVSVGHAAYGGQAVYRIQEASRHSLLLLVPLLMGGPTKATCLGSVKEGSGQSWKARMLDLP